MHHPIVFLVDNGSLRESATLQLRELANALMLRFEPLRIEAVSLLHSHKIDPNKLNGQPATIVKRRIRELVPEGHLQFIIIPLFLGPSLAVSEYLPSVIADLQQETPGLEVKIADVLCGTDPKQPDPRLAKILAKQLSKLELEETDRIALADHGTPHRPVNDLRNAVAQQLSDLLERPVQACSMERREGDEYAFNDPLLETLGSDFDSETSKNRLLLSMFFLLPGRHAGEGGDVAEICDAMQANGRFSQIKIADLMGSEPELLDVLEDRLRDVLPKA